ncbi:MAG: hypothetical protein OXQ96_03700, partial [Alphaproteobacteria bacterium]|nr:hypothetical protein [Alphaproteobacteria bacterium]
MGPRFRFMLVVVILATVIWAYFLVGEYLVGLRGLNLSRYIHGAFVVGSSVLGGYLLVWASIRFMNFRENRKTGFEAIKIDESGTKFNMQLSLSKFLPEIIAPT